MISVPGKMPILWRLQDRVMRCSELKKDVPHISDKMLTTQLRELEANGFVHRKVYAVVPPKTEYCIAGNGNRAILIIQTTRSCSLQLMGKEGLS